MSDWTSVWLRVVGGEKAAFELVVAKHQNVVAAVAFSIVGDFAISQDVAQETFWTAWRTRDQLREPSKLTAWLCGIARNTARQWKRREARQPHQVSAEVVESVSESSPADALVSAEEQSLIWGALGELPESYREVLILFYREGRSIADAAEALELSEDAVKQRLHRGREMIRAQLADVIEQTLVRSRPGRRFTARVMAGLTAAAALNSAPASAATTTVAGAATVASGALGILGAMAGTLAGFCGAWLGNWVPAQLAPTQTERLFLERQGLRLLLGGVVYLLAVLAVTVVLLVRPQHVLNQWIFFGGMAALSVALAICLIVQIIYVNRRVRLIRSEIAAADDPNDSPWKSRLEPLADQGPRAVRISYRSRWSLFGWPLVAIQLGPAGEGEPTQRGREARGWIAIGDRACGLILAIGGAARGLIAMGGFAVGGVALGGCAIGLFAAGGCALGGLALGGAGGGWHAVVGVAIGWQSAVGGGAVAYHVAYGGGALARDYAVGGGALAHEANTELAKQVVERESLKWMMDWFFEHQLLSLVVIVLVSIAPGFLMVGLRAIFQRLDRAGACRTGS